MENLQKTANMEEPMDDWDDVTTGEPSLEETKERMEQSRSLAKTLKACATELYIRSLKGALPARRDAASGLLRMTMDLFADFNAAVDRDGGIPVFVDAEELSVPQLARLVQLYEDVALLPVEDSGIPEIKSAVMVYQTEGEKKGTYTDGLFEAVVQFCPDTNYGMLAMTVYHVNKCLSSLMEEREYYSGQRLVAVENGIFDLKKKKLLPFTPEYAFRSKLAVEYAEGANGPVMRCWNGEEWDIDSWVAYFTQDPDSYRDFDLPAVWFIR